MSEPKAVHDPAGVHAIPAGADESFKVGNAVPARDVERYLAGRMIERVAGSTSGIGGARVGLVLLLGDGGMFALSEGRPRFVVEHTYDPQFDPENGDGSPQPEVTVRVACEVHQDRTVRVGSPEAEGWSQPNGAVSSEGPARKVRYCPECTAKAGRPS